MKLPTFTAEVSLYKSSQQYRTSRSTFGTSNTLQPATLGSLVLPSACPAGPCRIPCLNCKQGCLKLVGNAKGECLRECNSICDDL
jgi:hypothetical protein